MKTSVPRSNFQVKGEKRSSRFYMEPVIRDPELERSEHLEHRTRDLELTPSWRIF